MPIHDPIKDLLKAKKLIIIDGALATELEARGCNLNDKLWSAKILIGQPHLIQRIHYDYFEAGADIAITASYQATALGLSEACGFAEVQSSALIADSVKLAQQARNQTLAMQPTRRMLIAGSVGPYGAYLSDGSEYSGDYTLSDTAFRDFHRSRIDSLVAAGVDLLACETIPSFIETRALLKLLQEEFSDVPAWFSFTLRDDKHISDGTALQDVCDALHQAPQVVAIGVNCVAQTEVSPAIIQLRSMTDKPLLVYPNSGEVYDAKLKIWNSSTSKKEDFAALVKTWADLGAVLIGGCCRTKPSDIKVITEAFE